MRFSRKHELPGGMSAETVRKHSRNRCKLG